MPSVQVPGCTIHYELVDLTLPWVREPETILFHHGLGASGGVWRDWLPALIDRYKVLVFDMRGHGRSERPPVGAPLSLDLLIEDLFAVADATGIERFHLVGESIGGTIALKAAIERTKRIRSLTVCNGTHLGGSINSITDWQQIIDERGMLGWSEHMMCARFFDGAISPQMHQWYKREQSEVSKDVLLRALRMLAGVDLSPQLGEVAQPVLLLHPDSSPFISVSIMADLKTRLPDARLQVFAHSKHGLPFSHTRKCSAATRCFLDKISGPDRITCNGAP